MTTIALAGNPNSGKTSLFNRLTGLNQKVGNYSGVTVERRSGRARVGGRNVEVIDLPGTYSLVARGRDEAIAFEVMTGLGKEAPPDLLVLVVDATNLTRNLFLALSILELKRPTVVALNMIDEAQAQGIEIDVDALAERLGVAVVPVVARTGEHVPALEAEMVRALETTPTPADSGWRLDEEVAALAEEVKALLPEAHRSDAIAVWAVASGASAAAEASEEDVAVPALEEALALARKRASTFPYDPAAAMIEARYAYARDLVEEVETRKPAGPSLTDRIDAVLLHPVAGILVFALTMAFLFQSLFAWADPLMGLIESGVGFAQDWLRASLPEGALVDLLADGVVGGVGNVLVFIPQIAFLFGFLAILEDSGYLARAAFIADRLMARIGLHGRAFVPLLSGFACAVPAIMATRSIESRRDRLVTLLITPLVSCSARLPIYTLLIATLFSADRKIAGFLSVGGLMMFGLYALSVLFTVAVGFVLKRTLLASPTPALVLELPPYRRPELRNVVERVVNRCKVFITDAGTVILACSMILWALLYFPQQLPEDFDLEGRRAAVIAAADGDATVALAALDNEAEAARVANSIAGRLGRGLEPAFEPLGYDWKMVVGILASFAAREVFVSTMGLVYGMGDEADESSRSLRETLRSEIHPDTGKPVYTPLVGLSLMVFFLLALQCMSTVAAIKRETRSWFWPVFAFVYAGGLAWICAFLVYQTGRTLGFT